MITYIGTKVVQARPMSRGEYNQLRGWVVPADEEPMDPGYLVEYLDGGTPNHPDFRGYISWSPKEQFEKAYRSSATGMTFGHAIDALKHGLKVARAGWNGKGMWLLLVPGTKDVALRAGTPYQKALGEILPIEILPHIDMWTMNSQGRRAMLPGWVASQTDMLSEDWQLID